VTVEPLGPTTLAVVADDDGRVFDEVRDAIAATGVGLRRLDQRTASLEALFLGRSGSSDDT
jgi:hypothetical protein